MCCAYGPIIRRSARASAPFSVLIMYDPQSENQKYVPDRADPFELDANDRNGRPCSAAA